MSDTQIPAPQPTDQTPAPTVEQPPPAQEQAPATPPPVKPETDWKAEARKWEIRAKENNAAAKRLAEIEEASKSEAQKQAEAFANLQAENARLQAEALRSQVAATKGVPADLLAGTTEEELNAAADRLLEWGKTAPTPTPDFGAGDRGGSPSKPKQLSRADMARMTPDQIVAADDAGQFDDLKAGRH